MGTLNGSGKASGPEGEGGGEEGGGPLFGEFAAKSFEDFGCHRDGSGKWV